MRNVLLRAYLNNNFGDDLLVKLLCEKLKDIDFITVAKEDELATIGNVSNLSTKNFKYSWFYRKLDRFGRKIHIVFPGTYSWKLLKLSKNRVVIEIGGSVFILPKNGMGEKYYERIRLIKNANQYYILDSNFGPYYQLNQIEKYRKLLSNIDLFVVRDRFSYSKFRMLNSTMYSPDLALSIDKGNYKQSSQSIIFNVMKFANKKINVEYQKFVIRHIEKEVNNNTNHKSQIYLTALCVNEGDLEACKEIYFKLSRKAKKVVKVFVHTDVENTINHLASARKIFATRFHAMILAWAFNKPCFVVSYSKKTNHVISDLNQEQKYIDLKKLNEEVVAQYSVISEEKRAILYSESNKMLERIHNKINESSI